VQGKPWGKNQEQAFYYSGPVFDVKEKLLHKLLPTKKTIIYSLKVRKKKSCPQKLPTPPPPRLKKIKTKWSVP